MLVMMIIFVGDFRTSLRWKLHTIILMTLPGLFQRREWRPQPDQDTTDTMESVCNLKIFTLLVCLVKILQK